MQVSPPSWTGPTRHSGHAGAFFSVLCTPLLLLACATTTSESLRAEAGDGTGSIFLGSIRTEDAQVTTRTAGLTAMLGFCLDLQSGLRVTTGPDRLRALFSAGARSAEHASPEATHTAQNLGGPSFLLEGEVRGEGPEARLRLTLRGSEGRARSDWLALPGLKIAEFCRATADFARPAISQKSPSSSVARSSDSGGRSFRETGADAVRLADAIELWGAAALLEGEGKTDLARAAYGKAADRAPAFVHFRLETFRLRRFQFPDRYRRLLQKERQEIDGELRNMRGLGRKQPAVARLVARALIGAARDVAPVRPELALEFVALAEDLAPEERSRASAVGLIAQLFKQPAAAPHFDEMRAAGLYGMERLEFQLAIGVTLLRAGNAQAFDTLIARVAPGLRESPSHHGLVLSFLRAWRTADGLLFKTVARELAGRGLSQTQLHVAASTNGALLSGPELGTLQELRVRARLLGLEDDRLHAALLYGIGQAIERAGEKRAAGGPFRSAELIFRRLGFSAEAAQARAHSKNLILAAPFLPLPVQVRRASGFTPDEELVLASYTGLYDYGSHSPDVQARTYGGRQADTNVFLEELLDKKDHGPTLGGLRDAILPASADAKGSGVVFVDIGPAVANRWAPAITAESVAKDFPEMAVVALDLPDQVRRFHRLVSGKLKRSLFAKKNFRIIAADGVDSLKTQFAVRQSWVPQDRAITSIPPEALIVVRSANAVDIYLPFDSIRASLEQMAADFAEHSVLYFFNRSILFKPKRSRLFQIVGFVSVRGFHHNKVTFSREGDPAYSLSGTAIRVALQRKR